MVEEENYLRSGSVTENGRGRNGFLTTTIIIAFGRGQDNIVLRLFLELFYKRLSLLLLQQINYNQLIKSYIFFVYISTKEVTYGRK